MTAQELLERPYELDIEEIRRTLASTGTASSCQLLPPDGTYRTENEKGDLVRISIKEGRLESLPECKVVRFL